MLFLIGVFIGVIAAGVLINLGHVANDAIRFLNRHEEDLWRERLSKRAREKEWEEE